MSRSQRLLNLIQLLRGYRFPVPGAQLAEALGISLRTLYRDIATLQEQGAQIEGEPGLGYVLRPGFLLPPLMFSEEELEAIVLGSRWVARRTDPRLSEAAKSALAKVSAVLPRELQHAFAANGLLVGPGAPLAAGLIDQALLRRAIRAEHKLTLHYRDLKGEESTRTVWPFALGYFDQVQVLAAWCEWRQGFRHFRTDGILAMTVESARYPRSRQSLMHEWGENRGIEQP